MPAGLGWEPWGRGAARLLAALALFGLVVAGIDLAGCGRLICPAPETGPAPMATRAAP